MELRKIAVPVYEGVLPINFNDADKFFIYSVEHEEVVKEEMEIVERNKPEEVVTLLSGLGISEVLSCEMEQSVIDSLLNVNVGVVLSAPVMSPKELVYDYLEQTAHHHHHHGEGDSCCGGGGGGCGCDH